MIVRRVSVHSSFHSACVSLSFTKTTKPVNVQSTLHWFHKCFKEFILDFILDWIHIFDRLVTKLQRSSIMYECVQRGCLHRLHLKLHLPEMTSLEESRQHRGRSFKDLSANQMLHAVDVTKSSPFLSPWRNRVCLRVMWSEQPADWSWEESREICVEHKSAQHFIFLLSDAEMTSDGRVKINQSVWLKNTSADCEVKKMR